MIKNRYKTIHLKTTEAKTITILLLVGWFMFINNGGGGNDNKEFFPRFHSVLASL